MGNQKKLMNRLDSISNLTLRRYLPPMVYSSIMDTVQDVTKIVQNFRLCLQESSQCGRHLSKVCISTIRKELRPSLLVNR